MTSQIIDLYGFMTAKGDLYTRETIAGQTFAVAEQTLYTTRDDWFGILISIVIRHDNHLEHSTRKTQISFTHDILARFIDKLHNCQLDTDSMTAYTGWGPISVNHFLIMNQMSTPPMPQPCSHRIACTTAIANVTDVSENRKRHDLRMKTSIPNSLMNYGSWRQKRKPVPRITII